MKKISKKFLQIIMLISMIFSSLQTPMYVLADTLTEEATPKKGDIRLGSDGEISQSGTVSVTAGSKTLENAGDVQVVKTVTRINNEGKYKVDFTIKGVDIENKIVVTKPIYLVVVFDTSGSMICDSTKNSYSYATYNEAYNAGDRINNNNNGGWGPNDNNEHVEPKEYTAADGNSIWCSNASQDDSYVLKDKWEKAVSGAVTFSESLAAMDNTNISLVTFATNASSATDFKHGALTASEFGHPVGSTNLKAAIETAQAKLDGVTAENAQKYILVIGDGEPTAGGYQIGSGWNAQTISATQAAKIEATQAKNAGTKIFAIGYGLTDTDTEAKNVLKYISSNTTVVSSNPTGTETGTYADNGYYQEANTTGLSGTLNTIFESVGEASKAGKDATLTDGIGGKFKIVTENDTEVSSYGVSYVSENIDEITEEGTTLSFYVQIDKDAPTGWYNTNANFNLTYTDSNGDSQTINYTENPEVYWIQNQYDYIVNYYKDSITEENLLATENRQAPAGTIINENNVEKDKYLTNAGEGYEFNGITPTSITITNDGETKVINILYTIKKYSYNVNYYYDNVLDTELSHSITNVNHGTVVSSESYYLTQEEIKEGYKLDTINTDKGNVTIDSNGKSIDIYYIKDSFEFTINYHFNEILNSNLTKNDTATYEEVIKAEDNKLTNEELVANNYSDYFLHPTKPYDPTQIKIDTNKENNVLNLYYINTFVKEENIDKTTNNIDKITSQQAVVNYQVVYTSTVKNVKENEKIIVTIIDTLPYEIDETKSNLNGGVYNNKTITWTIEIPVTEFTETYEINETINYQVVYKNFADLSSKENNNLVNNVLGKTTVANKTTQGVEDSTETPVEIYGKLTVKHVDESGENLLNPTTTTELVGTDYTTTKEEIYGYTLKEVKGSENGKYTEEDITVTYVYTKKDGTTTKNEVTKAQINPILGTTSTFKYVLTYSGKVENYVGQVKVTLEDTLPYEISSIEYDEASCKFDENTRTLTCTKSKNLTETDNSIDATFEVIVTYKNLTSEVDLEITNNVKSTLTYGNKEETDNDEVTDTILSGKVTAVYVDESNNQLAESVTTTGLIDTYYETNDKTIYGYTLKEVKGPETGKYTKEDITVTYIYTKNDGTTTKNEVTKTGIENITSINDVFNYTLTYNGKITDYVGEATLTLKDILPYEIDEELSSYDNRCTYENKVLTCTETYIIDEEKQEINDEFKLSLVFKNIDSDKVVNKVESTLDYGKDIPETDKDETKTEVFKGTVIATYKNTEGQTLTENIITEGLAGDNYETEELEFLGYTLTKTPENKLGEYKANETIYVNYIYEKNVGTSEEELEKQGPEKITDINAPFEYKITYNVEINDYVGDVNVTLTDYLPYEIDEEKSSLGNVCKYIDGKIVCEYLQTITNKENSIIRIEENLVLYYKNITSNEVTNRIESIVKYGDEEKKNEDEYTTEIAYGTLVVNYVTEDGKTLSPTTISTDLAGTSYTTEQKVFDNYYLKEVVGNETGVYVEGETEVTYVYSLIPLPPQTGVELPFTNYIGLFIFATVILILKRRYL